MKEIIFEHTKIRAVPGDITEITDEDWNIIREFIKNEKLLCMISTRSNQHKS